MEEREERAILLPPKIFNHSTFKHYAMIKLQNVEKVYRTSSIETLALNNINIDVKKGEFVSIMGPSGCGKSTLLNIIGLLDAPSKGQIEIDGSPVERYTDKHLAELRNRKLGFIFQSFHLINDLSVIDNVEIPLLYRNTSARQRRELAQAALEKVGLSNRMKHFPKQLSGGQKQRVAIARAIVGNPEIILADEPTGNLDSAMGNEILGILQKLNSDGATIVMVTHDVQEAFELGDRVCLMDKGQMVQVGKPAELLFNPANDFVRGFLQGQRLQLELKTIKLNDLWRFLPDTEGDHRKISSIDTTIWTAMDLLKNRTAVLHLKQADKPEMKSVDFEHLMLAFHHYQNRRHA